MKIRHALGVFGVLAAGVLIAVSAAMNWRFGFSLGRTELDGQIYGAASVAADCLKALIPFFLFAAIRNRMWSQAAAAAVVGVVVTAYSLTSALGHAALNRFDTAGHRMVEAQSYKDLRGDLKRAQDQLSWIPQHRPAATVQGEIEALKNQRAWSFTKACSEVTGRQGRDFCQKYHGLNAEMASGHQAEALEARIAGIQSKLGKADATTVMGEADPQAAVLAKLAGVSVDQVQMAMTIFIALLLEVGSAFGMYIAFSQWRLYDREAPAAPKMSTVQSTASAAVAAPQHAAVAIKKPRFGANDNRSLPPTKLLVPETDVQRFYKESVESQDGHTVSATSLYEAYCVWCEERQKEPLALPTFGREIAEFGIQKVKKKDGVRYVGIALKSDLELEEDKKLPALRAEAA
ncbi:primase-like DNA-binding domain-containing protein [Hyphomicrobium sp.]|uniref:primase-like DNA-binding domain-containing protein n=1 Tax=Hyphomicrobium sp. TaxID=82 RepID=UPI0025B88791|nr:primase-like DNA-binding domain-containing protein [Hyphomicrobium sp.]